MWMPSHRRASSSRRDNESATNMISPLRRRLRVIAVVLISATTLSSCAATTFDESIATTTAVSVPFTIPSGTTDDLLRNLSTAMNGLSVLIGPDSSGRTPAGKNEQLQLIEVLWDAVQTDVTSSDPDAADAIGRMVAQARTAVERNRPADADKAARFAGQVITKYLSNA